MLGPIGSPDTAPPGAQVEKSRGRGSFFAVDSFAKLLGLVATLCYVTGFLIVNASLVGLGAAEFSTFSPRLVFIGALALALAASVFVLPFVMAWVYASTDRWWIKGFAIFFGVLGFLGPLVLYSWLFQSQRNVFLSEEEGPLGGARMVIRAAGHLLLGHSSRVQSLASSRGPAGSKDTAMPARVRWLAWRASAPRDTSQAAPWMRGIFWASLATACFLAYVVLFGHFVYPTLPNQLGGGRPGEVRLVVSKDAKTLLANLGLCTKSTTGKKGVTGEVSVPVRILFESGDAYLVRTVDTGYLSLIRKDAILAIHISDSGTTACVES